MPRFLTAATPAGKHPPKSFTHRFQKQIRLTCGTTYPQPHETHPALQLPTAHIFRKNRHGLKQNKKHLRKIASAFISSGPDRAWTYDLQIMRTIRWRFVIARLTNLNWIAVSYKIHYPLWDSLNTPNWNRLFTHCLRRIGCIKTVIRPIGNNARSLFCFAQVLLLSQIICVFATKKWSVTLNIDNKSTLTFSTPT